METSRSERKGTSVNAVSGVRFVGIDWWPGGGLGIALKPGLGCAIIVSLVGFSAAGATNEWTKSTSGSWEESYWSLGQLPGMNQELVAFRNPGWKALAIGANTTANYPASLSLNNLLVEAPTDSFNQLLLDWAGLSVPLVVHSNLKIGANGSLASHYSGLHAANAYIDGSASFSDYSTEEFAQLWLRSGATLNLTNGTMTCSNLPFYTATFTQSGGTHIAQIINLPVISSDLSPSGIYYLQGGALISAQVWMGAGGGYGPEGLGTVWQTGGVHTNFELEVGGWVHHGGSIHLGSYRLDGGLLASSNVDVYGSFSQGGGTNVVQQLNVGEGGDFWLSGGELITSNATVYRDPNVVNQGFVQTEGVHTVRGRLLIEGWPYGDSGSPSYTLMGGKLVTAANIEINSGALCISSHGVVLNTGMLTLSGGTLVGDNASETQYLGQLQCARGNLDMRPRYGTGTNATVLQFADSHTLAWTGPLQINNWGLNPGDHIYFSTNAQGLASAQLDQIRFARNDTDYYPAILLPTGEVVPVSGSNEWTKPTSGNWEESYWSLGRLPGMDQSLVTFSNPGWKALTIGAAHAIAVKPDTLFARRSAISVIGGP